MNIYDKILIKDGKELKKVYLLFVDEDKKTCDCCDEKKECASIGDLMDHVTIMCKDCLMDIVKEFD